LPPAGGSGAAFCGYTEYPQIYERQYGIMWDFKFSRRRVWCSELWCGV
jgi:hypothetical protein